eukprot:gene23780-biopygen8891
MPTNVPGRLWLRGRGPPLPPPPAGPPAWLGWVGREKWDPGIRPRPAQHGSPPHTFRVSERRRAPNISSHLGRAVQ